jgi:NADPH2:quinone reductase
MSREFEPAAMACGLVVRRLGDWRDVAVGLLPLDAPGPGEVLIAPEACALNFQDLLLIEGKYQYEPPMPFIAGRDVAGTIVAVGPGVSKFAVGDRVSAQLRHGAFADLARAPVDRCFRIPQSIDAGTAAAAGTVFATVAVALTMRAQLRAGERLMVTGAAGGVGMAAIQYGKYLGADVVALVSSEAKADAVRKAGADQVLVAGGASNLGDLRDLMTGQGIDLVDVVLDVVGGDVFDATIRCLRSGGRLLAVGFASGRIAALKTNYPLLKEIAVIGSSLENVLNRNDPALGMLMAEIYDTVDAGGFGPVITARYSFAEFHRAAAEISGRHAIGKIVLLP